MQAIRRHPAAVPVRALHEFIAKSGAPVGRIRRNIRNAAKVQLRRVLSTHEHCERVIEPERRHHLHTEPSAILFLYAMKYGGRIAPGRFIQIRGEGRASIFGIKIDFPRNKRLMTEQRTAEIDAPFHVQRRMRLNLLREQLRENNLFGKILRADDNRFAASSAATRGQRQCAGQQQKRASRKTQIESRRKGQVATHCFAILHWRIPRALSARTASNAAGIAPARITELLTIETPRKMNTPKPPAPMAAAIVVTPMQSTVATRMPASNTGAANGSSTCQRTCP